MLAMRLTYFENLIDISRIDELKNIERRDDELSGRGGHAARTGRDGRRGGRIGSAADVVDALHRPFPDPDQGHARRRDRARRPRRGVRRGRARARRDDGGDVIARPTGDSGGRILHRACGRRRWRADEILTAVRFPVWGGPVRLRGRGIRAAPRRFRDRRRNGRGASSTTTTGWRDAASGYSGSARLRCAARRPRMPSSASRSTPSPLRRSAGSR